VPLLASTLEIEKMVKTKQLFALSAFAFLPTACTGDGAETLVVTQNLAPSDDCQFTPSDTLFGASGIVDTNSDLGYLFAPSVTNTATTEGADANRRTVIAGGAEVTISIDESVVPLATQAMLREPSSAFLRFTKEFSGPIAPNNGKTPFSFEAIPKSVIMFLSDALNGASTTVTISVVVFGKMGNQTVESAPFVFPVTVCTDCMKTRLDSCANLPDVVPSGYACSSPGVPGGERLQDNLLLCCGPPGAPICPAVEADAG